MDNNNKSFDPNEPTTQNIQTETRSVRTNSHIARRIVNVIFSAAEVILGLRLIMKLLGANAESAFVKTLYGITGFFVRLFEGIFSSVTINESTGAVFEPATLIAMIIIALIALGISKLMSHNAGSSVVKTEYSGPPDQNDRQK